MAKIRITIEVEGKIEQHEADSAVIVMDDGGTVTLTQVQSNEQRTLGLLKIAEWHVRKVWDRLNREH